MAAMGARDTETSMHGDSSRGVSSPRRMEDAPDYEAEVLLASYETGGESALCGVQGLCTTEPIS